MASSTASAAQPSAPISGLLKRADLIFTGALFLIVMMLIVPVPAFILDAMLAVQIGLSLLVLIVVIYVKEPAEFSGFPTLLLGLTLYRLALNIASTRLILTEGHAGNIIDSFGRFVIQGNYIVGFVVFLILIVINFVVITKGAGRIAEVSARFTLDAMPGKQMAIDAELNAGIIDEQAATTRRLKVQKEADFYGAMDGASKFVRGDAIAGILITARTGSGQPVSGSEGLELEAITAAALGGAALKGGKGTIAGTILAVILLGILTNGMTLLGVNSFWQNVAKGARLVVAVIIQQLRSGERRVGLPG